MVNCANRNCNYNMPPDYFSIHLSYEKLKRKHKYELYDKIVDGLIKMELFCITCCVNQTNIICSNSNIQIKDYSIGYTHKPDKI
jgi:hypothetical protein